MSVRKPFQMELIDEHRRTAIGVVPPSLPLPWPPRASSVFNKLFHRCHSTPKTSSSTRPATSWHSLQSKTTRWSSNYRWCRERGKLEPSFTLCLLPAQTCYPPRGWPTAHPSPVEFWPSMANYPLPFMRLRRPPFGGGRANRSFRMESVGETLRLIVGYVSDAQLLCAMKVTEM